MKQIKIVAAFLIILCFAACRKDSLNHNVSLKVDRDELKSTMALHSQGLRYVLENFIKKGDPMILKASSGGGPVGPPDLDPPTGGGGDPEKINNAVMEFLLENDITPTNEIYLFPNMHNDSLHYTVLSSTGNKFSRSFYEVCNSITNINPQNLTEAETQINQILASQKYLALTSLEQRIAGYGAETYLDSYAYWSSMLGDWNTAFNASIKRTGLLGTVPPRKDINKISWDWNKIKDKISKYTRADVKGGVAGGIGGAVTGAIVAGTASGGLAAPGGAASGAAVGALGGAITNSVLVFLDDTDKTPTQGGQPEPDPGPIEHLNEDADGDSLVEIYPGLFIPTYWDLIVREFSQINHPIPNIF